MEPIPQLFPTSTKYFIAYFRRLGVNLSDKLVTHPSSLRAYLIVTAGVLQMALSIVLSIQQWNHINTRVAAFTKFGEYSICTLAFGYLVFNPDHCVKLFDLTDIPLDVSARKWDDEQQTIRNEANNRAKTIQKLYLAAGITLWFFTNFIPCLSEMGMVLIRPLDDIKDADIFFLFYFKPFLTHRTIIVYCIISLLQSFLYLIMIATTSLHYSVVTSSIKMVEAEVKILCVSIRVVTDDVITKKLFQSKNKVLRGYLNDVIRHHQAIITLNKILVNYQKDTHHGEERIQMIELQMADPVKGFFQSSVQKLNNVAGFLLIAFNGVITTQLSLELYCTLETDKPWMHLSRIPGSVVCYGVLCFLGQGLINEGDNLKRSLEWFPWVDAPQWFKTSLFLMITSTKKPLEIKPSGLYVLNSSNWMSVIQAAYSYLNMMRSFKANRNL